MLRISWMQRRKLNLKAQLEGGSSYYSFKRAVPGAFSVSLTGSTFTVSPEGRQSRAEWCP
jgi:hypothetical protein